MEWNLVRQQKQKAPKRFVVQYSSTRTDKIDLTNEQIYDIVGFP